MTWNPNATVTIAGNDFTGNTLNGLAIHYGRPTIWQQARSSYATIDILNTTNVNNDFEINDPVVVTVKDSDGTTITVFTGVITEVSGQIAASGSNATVAVETITAVGPFAQMSRTTVGKTSYPKEYDDDRINRILTEAGVTIDVVDTPGVYELTARSASPIDAYTLSTYYAQMCFGYMYETKTGAVGYANESRRTVDVNTSGYLDIDEGYINWRGINSRKSISDILNRIILFYKDNEQVTSDDAASIASYGLYEATVSTELHNLDEAQNIADRYVSLRSKPEYNFSSFNINLDNPNLLAADLDALINIEMGTAIQIDNLPNAISSISYQGFVEGWDLVINEMQASLTITSSDSTYSVVPIRWQDVDPTIQWEDIDPSATRSTKTNLVQNPSFEPVDYGKLGYIYTPGASGYFISTPDASALDITGDIDIRVKVAMDDWTPAGLTALVSKASSYELYVTTLGRLQFFWTANGTTYNALTSSASPTIADGNALWVRVAFDVDNGASGRTAKFYTSNDGTNWTQLGSDQTSATATSLFNSTSDLRFNTFAGTSFMAAAKIYAASIRNGIDGTEVFQFDVGGNWKPTDIDSFTAQTGQTVSLSSSMTPFILNNSSGITYTRDSSDKYIGNTALKVTRGATAAGSIYLRPSVGAVNLRPSVANGDTLYFQARIKQGLGSRTARLRMFTYQTATSTTVVETFTGTTQTLDSTWKLLQLTANLTNANSLFVEWQIDMVNTGLSTDFIYIDALILEKNSGGYAAYYFDGSYSEIPADRDSKLAWTGTANDSTSTGNAYWGTKPTTLWQNVDTVGLPQNRKPMATSTTYGWTEPDDADYLKEGAEAIRVLGNAIDTTMNKIENFKGEIQHPFLLMGA